jgi:hypothetical protein
MMLGPGGSFLLSTARVSLCPACWGWGVWVWNVGEWFGGGGLAHCWALRDQAWPHIGTHVSSLGGWVCVVWGFVCSFGGASHDRLVPVGVVVVVGGFVV